MRKLLLFFVSVSLSYSLYGQTQTYKTEENIRYVDADVSAYEKSQCLLDIHYPTSGEEKPIVFWFHGGGLTGGKKEIPAFLKNKDHVVVGVGYPFSPQVTVREIISRAAQAISFTMKNAKKYRVDKNSVFLSGHSAGAYLALMLAFDKSYLAKEEINADDLTGVISFSAQAITHFTARKEKNMEEKQPLIDDLAPLYWVRKDAPPVLLMTGNRDLEMLGRYEENAYLERMLSIVGHPDHKLLEFDGYGHDMVYPGLPILLQEVKRLTNKKN